MLAGVLLLAFGLVSGVAVALVGHWGLRTMPASSNTTQRRMGFVVLMFSILLASLLVAVWLVRSVVRQGVADGQSLVNLYVLGLVPPLLFFVARWWRRV